MSRRDKRHRARMRMPKVSEITAHDTGGYCAEHGKMRFISRRAARRVERKMRARTGRQNVFECGSTGWFHLGHLPRGVRNGTYSKKELSRSDR